MKPLRIAFPIVASCAWQGGFNYQLNLCRALVRHMHREVEVVAYFGHDSASIDRERFQNETGIEVICHPAFSSKGQTFRLIKTLIFGIDHLAKQAFDEAKIDLVFESARFFGRHLRQATIAWFPDFQHRRLPYLFSWGAWLKRDVGFRVQMRYGRAILVSSRDAQKDCERYYPDSSGRIYALPFPALIAENDLLANPTEILQLYELPNRFVYLPNQFWSHKNHALVIDALEILQQRGVFICVVSTGATHDPRQPSLFTNIQKKLHRLNLEKSFRVLGLVPRAHVIALLRCCTVFLNPSKCEGWSSGVEEAKLFGVPMLLSDLGVHHEQAGCCAQYFPVDNPIVLADLIQESVLGNQETNINRSVIVENDLANREYAKAFTEIARATIEANRK